MRPREADRISMLVVHIQRKVSIGMNIRFRRLPYRYQMPFSVNALGE